MRRGELIQALVEFGLMPPDPEARKELQHLDPYSLRARALDQSLRPFELGRALFHLDQRRGFKSNPQVGQCRSGREEKDRRRDRGICAAESKKAAPAPWANSWRGGTRSARRSAPARNWDYTRTGPCTRREFDKIRQEQEEHNTLSPDSVGHPAQHHLLPAASATGGTGLVPI